MPQFPCIKKLEAVGNRKQLEKVGNKVKALTFHSVTAPAAGRNVAVKCVLNACGLCPRDGINEKVL